MIKDNVRLRGREHCIVKRHSDPSVDRCNADTPSRAPCADPPARCEDARHEGPSAQAQLARAGSQQFAARGALLKLVTAQ